MADIPRHLRWRCRRGTRELDVLLERFLEAGYCELDASGRENFEHLLAVEDDRLIDWLLTGRDQPQHDGLADVAARIRRAAGL